ncbi:hypothetical protein HG264_14085 [Pseudomonas sp. gcc21]|uniref:DUF6957 family protein n=1 Tax=Pseudomonas sp. gcc21 TaxID=2726989 RepID=UPI0014519A8B|nr:hypothetical protein [Pseudomonas sp. gcc21]QJD59949.1 hypothetical protein HG264_14085 [Pseudomonas sp. gcc21]
MNELNELTDLLYGEGEPMQGGNLTLEEAKMLVRAHTDYKPFRIVRDWIWAELNVAEKIADDLQQQDLKPVMVYAHDVMFDSTHRFAPGNWVRTTPLLRFTPPCIFETTNTVYILVGEGKRKTTSLQTIMSIC